MRKSEREWRESIVECSAQTTKLLISVSERLGKLETRLAPHRKYPVTTNGLRSQVASRRKRMVAQQERSSGKEKWTDEYRDATRRIEVYDWVLRCLDSIEGAPKPTHPDFGINVVPFDGTMLDTTTWGKHD